MYKKEAITLNRNIKKNPKLNSNNLKTTRTVKTTTIQNIPFLQQPSSF